mmetsp:Transcript_35101/g.74062  ORF Transcript_35101/g.74062 Transcript_35101/m.74062 type:complete len:245 (+) Transcript_35101:2650-3384(+)
MLWIHIMLQKCQFAHAIIVVFVLALLSTATLAHAKTRRHRRDLGQHRLGTFLVGPQLGNLVHQCVLTMDLLRLQLMHRLFAFPIRLELLLLGLKARDILFQLVLLELLLQFNGFLACFKHQLFLLGFDALEFFLAVIFSFEALGIESELVPCLLFGLFGCPPHILVFLSLILPVRFGQCSKVLCQLGAITGIGMVAGGAVGTFGASRAHARHVVLIFPNMLLIVLGSRLLPVIAQGSGSAHRGT